ncbi:hypothetical protein Tco_1055382 [Tanacetum coccineum]|uniref:Uncharacterized protein n=1 Tax=Tanacetum coccineum TaxID=301880 RepID=A0ABQ5H067_9ASTR
MSTTKASQDSDYFKDKNCFMQAQESGGSTDEEQLFFCSENNAPILMTIWMIWHSIGTLSVNATPTVKIFLNKGKQIWKPKGKLSDNSLNKTKQIWQPKGKLSDNRKKFTSGKLNCGYQWRPTGKKYALGELCPLTRLPVTCCSKLDLEEEMAPVHNSSGPEPKMMFGQNSSSLVLHQMMSAQISSGLAPQCLKMLDHSSSSLGLHCQKTFEQISSNLVSQMSQRRLWHLLQWPRP